MAARSSRTRRCSAATWWWSVRDRLASSPRSRSLARLWTSSCSKAGRRGSIRAHRDWHAADLDPTRHAAMSMTTRRQLGGASKIWGGRCVQFDPLDFDRRDLVPDATWPVDYAAISAVFQRTCDWLICGRAVFDAERIAHLAGRKLVPGLPDGCPAPREHYGRQKGPAAVVTARVRTGRGWTSSPSCGWAALPCPLTSCLMTRSVTPPAE